jgi:penicillin-binding protein 1A
MAVRVLREVGLDNTIDYLTRFGFDKAKLPHSETIALGAGSLTPVQMARGYSVFANNGYFVEPFYISRIESPYGEVEYEANPVVVCHIDCPEQDSSIPSTEEVNSAVDQQAEVDSGLQPDSFDFQEEDLTTTADSETQPRYAPQVITAQNAFLVRELMYSNVWGGGDWRNGTGWNGTGWRAQKLKRRDIGGKTGTTNDAKDAWYNGFGPGVVAVSWVGFDSHTRELGRTSRNANLTEDEQVYGGEAGAKTAQPAWIDFMRVALDGVPNQRKALPENIIRVRIDRETGLLTHESDSSTMFEYFIKDTEPTEYVEDTVPVDLFSTDGEPGEAEPLF